MDAHAHAHVYASELAAMASAMADFPDHETGGALFGLWTHTGAPVVMLATGPGPRARHLATAFYQDERFLADTHHALWEGHGLQHLGDWHSHHRIGLAVPSSGDVRTVQEGLPGLGWRRYLLGIGNFPHRTTTDSDFGFFLFDAATGAHRQVRVRVFDGVSPVRAAAPRLPAEAPPVRRGWLHRAPAWSVRAPDALPEAWFAAPEVKRRLGRELRALEAVGFRADLRVDGTVLSLAIDTSDARRVAVTLPEGFPVRAPFTADLPLAEAWHPDDTVAGWVYAALAAERSCLDTGEEGAAAPRCGDAGAFGGAGEAPEPPRAAAEQVAPRDEAVRDEAVRDEVPVAAAAPVHADPAPVAAAAPVHADLALVAAAAPVRADLAPLAAAAPVHADLAPVAPVVPAPAARDDAPAVVLPPRPPPRAIPAAYRSAGPAPLPAPAGRVRDRVLHLHSLSRRGHR